MPKGETRGEYIPNGETLLAFRLYVSHYRNRDPSVRRKAAEPHLKYGGVYAASSAAYSFKTVSKCPVGMLLGRPGTRVVVI